MTFIKNNHHMTAKNSMILVFFDKLIELLDSGDDDGCVGTLELLLEFGCTAIAISCSFFKFVILFHRLIIQIFSIHHKQDFFDRGNLAGKLCSLEAG